MGSFHLSILDTQAQSEVTCSRTHGGRPPERNLHLLTPSSSGLFPGKQAVTSVPECPGQRWHPGWRCPAQGVIVLYFASWGINLRVILWCFGHRGKIDLGLLRYMIAVGLSLLQPGKLCPVSLPVGIFCLYPLSWLLNGTPRLWLVELEGKRIRPSSCLMVRSQTGS